MSAPVCVYGEPMIGPHPLCEIEADRLCALFEADVTAGTYDAEGYTPKERKNTKRKLCREVEALATLPSARSTASVSR